MIAVIGLGFGDEGKGLATDFLCSEAVAGGLHPVVVRFNGGHQAGHTVVRDSVRHVFSHFGSGTLLGAPTVWSRWCTFEPIGFMNERQVLRDKGVDPVFVADPLCPVTTPYDIAYNRDREGSVRHGSVGVGFGATLQREEDHRHLFLQDLLCERVVVMKLHYIKEYYKGLGMDVDIDTRPFLLAANEAIKLAPVLPTVFMWDALHPLIFEGAQGVLLDQRFGFFPHVTRSNTTSTNAREFGGRSMKTLFVTRSYQTRHGNGPMMGGGDGKPVVLKNNADETNVSHSFQGEFRTAPLDPEMLRYAMRCDGSQNADLLITCMDQYEIDVRDLLNKLKTPFGRVLLSYGPSAKDVIEYKS
ncbi:MAG TPA: adenylosuccinate synthetase [Flavobacteriales bacterium]|nr:adenylosuccinate synthetase [Flavobacteriales bacterium]